MPPIKLRYIFSICLLLAIGLALLLSPASVRAHADYERSDPAAGSIVPTAPDAVHIWFTQELFRREGENWIIVLSPDGSEAHLGEAQIDDDDRTLLSVELQPDLPEGEYIVQWRTLSADDGDSEEGEFTFKVDPLAPEPTPPPPPTSTAAPSEVPTDTPAEPSPPTEEPQASRGLPCLGSALLGLLAVAAIWFRRK